VSLLNFRSVFSFHPNKCVYNSLSGLVRPDYVVDKSTFCCLQRIGERFLVVGSLLLNVLASENNLNSSFRSHNSDFGIRPGVVEITSQVLGGHHIVCATIGFTCNESQFRNRGFGISVKQFSTMLDNTSILLSSSRHKPRDVHKGN
jgi:hypothetical protein